MGESEFISIFNDVLGPVMRGPSSSHTAGSYHIGRLARSLLNDEPRAASFVFDPHGSYAKTYRQQGADLAFAAGLMAWSITDRRFPRALDIAREKGFKLSFRVAPLKFADHPNTVEINLEGRSGKRLKIFAKSTGGGGIVISRLVDWPVALTGKAYELVILAEKLAIPQVKKIADSAGASSAFRVKTVNSRSSVIHIQRPFPLKENIRSRLESLSGVKNIWLSDPMFFVKKGESLFTSAEDMVRFSTKRRISLGRAALLYESQLLGISEKDVLAEMKRRFKIMQSSVHQGLRGKSVRMQLLKPSARTVYSAESRGLTALGGIHTRAAARALAAMHVSNSGGVVCAAPTGGSAGVIPAVIVTLAEEKSFEPEKINLALLAAGAIGLIIVRRATFAAEIAGCQVEIGAAGAMAAALVVDAFGGSAKQAADAAAIALQNTMGSVCDLVQGLCEIPCHTRNAAAASSAFVCADLILGGYKNPVPLDETIDAVFSCGKMLPRELRCTALGGLATTPSALALSPKKAFSKRSRM
jgi:L-serine dehydratase